MMKKLLLLFTTLLFGVGISFGQLSYFEGWEDAGAGLAGWANDGTGGSFSRNTTLPCTGNASARANIYQSGNIKYFISPLLGTSNGESTTLTFNYKVVIYSWSNPINPAPCEDFTIDIEWGTSSSGPWTDLGTINCDNHVESGTCAEDPGSYQFTPNLGDDVYIRFVVSRLSGDNYFYFDDVSVEQEIPAGAPGAPTNPSPTDAATGVALNGNLTWDFGADTDTYDLWFGPASNMTEVVTAGVAGATGSYTYADLTSGGIAYEWQVIAYNSSKATTTGPVWGFVTDATITEFPYLQDFDDAWIGTPAAPAGWTVINANSDSYLWSRANTYISPTHSGTYAAHGMGNTDDWLISPPIDLTDVNARISWWDKVESATRPNSYKVYVSTTTNEITSFTVELGDYTCTNTSWEQYFLDLSAYNDQTIYIGFHQYASAATNYGFGIDDFEINEILAQAPETATIGFPYDELTTFNNPLLSWTASATGEPATGFKVYLDETDPPATEVYDGANSSFQTADLDPGTTYYWKVVPYNANGNAEGAEVWSFTTATETQLAESFETAVPPTGWANPGGWSRSTSQTLHESASAYKWSAAAENLLSTPLLNMTVTSKIEFFARTASSNTAQRIQIKYSTDRVSWTNIGAAIELASNAAFAHYSVDLSTLGVDKGNYYIAFAAYNTGTAGSVYVDHVIGPEPAAVVPDAVTLTAPADAATDQSNTPSLSWTAAATGGIPTGYKVYLDENPNPNTLYATVATSPYTVNPALDYSTTYFWKVVATNATGDGAASAIRSFTTMADPTLTPPIVESFGSVPPLNWTRFTGLLEAPTTFTGASTVWTADGFANDGTTGAAKINIYGTTRKDWLITPPIDLGDGSVDYWLVFDLALTEFGSTNPPELDGVDDKFAVVISTDGGITWTSANTLMLWDNAGSANVYNDISHTGEEVEIDLTGYSGIIKIGFYGESTVTNADNDLFIDNVLLFADVTLDWYNLQWPGTATIKEWGNETIYAQAYKDGVTDPEGQAEGIECWIGYSTEDTDPATWTEWVVATYNGDAGNNDEYKADLGFDQLLEAGTYYYASRFSYLGGPYTYGGFNAGGKGPWNGTTDINGVLTVEEDAIDWANLQFPGTAEITEGGNADVFARIYVENLTAVAGESDAIDVWIGVSGANTDPSTWAPGAWTAADFNEQLGNDDEYMATIGADHVPGTYYYASRFSLAGGDYVYGGYSDTRAGGFWDGTSNVSGVLTVNAYSVSSFPYVEDFEGSVPGWSVYDIDEGGTEWEIQTIQNNTPGGEKSARHSYSAAGMQDGYFVSPEVELPATGSYVMNFWSYNLFPSFYDKNSVLISTASGNPVDGDLVEVWTTGSVATSWVQTTIDLSAFAGESIFIAFRYEGNDAHTWHIDDVTIRNNETPIVWTGAVNSNWHTGGNWNPVAVPTATDDVTIPAGLTNYPTLSAAGECNDIMIGSSAAGTASLLDAGYLTVSGEATIQRYLNGGGYHFVSVPINGTPTAGLFMNSYLYQFDAVGQAWDGVGDDPTTAITNDQGYMIWYTGANTTYDFEGDLITGAFTTATPSSGAVQYQYNLVPNPYPSALDWDAVTGWTKTNLNDAIYLWNRTATDVDNPNGQYASYIAGASTNSGSQYIPVGQAFFVETDGNGAPVLAIDNDARVHSDQAFFKSKQELPDLLRIYANSENGQDEIVMRLHDEATENFDGAFDASKLFGSETLPQLYSLTAEKRMLSINSFKLSDEVTIVPMGVEWAEEGVINLMFNNLESFDSNTLIYLEDLLTGQMINLCDQQEYSFTHASDNDPLRFRLHFKGVVGLDEQSLTEHLIWSYDDKVYVSIPALTGEKAIIQLVDLQGKMIYQGEHNLSNPEIITVRTNQHVLVARIIAGKQVFTNKLFIR